MSSLTTFFTYTAYAMKVHVNKLHMHIPTDASATVTRGAQAQNPSLPKTLNLCLTQRLLKTCAVLNTSVKYLEFVICTAFLLQFKDLDVALLHHHCLLSKVPTDSQIHSETLHGTNARAILY